MRSTSFKKYVHQTFLGQLWLFALSCLGFFLTLLPCLAIIFAQDLPSIPRWEVEERLLNLTLPGFEGSSRVNILFLLVSLGLAVITAFVHFSYLHDGRQADFIHCLPLRREKHFLARLLAAVFNFLPAVGTTLLAVLFTGLRGFLFKRLLLALLIRLAAGFVFYLLTYLTACLAMLLTGRLLVGALGILVFWVLGPALQYTLRIARQVFFAAYWYLTPVPEWNLSDVSPVAAADHAFGLLPYREGLVALGICALLCLPLLFLCLWLYKKRPLEAAGHAMAFPALGRVIQVLLTACGGFAAAVLFTGLRNGAPLMLLLLLTGNVLIYGIIQFLYTGGFLPGRKGGSREAGTLLGLLAALLLSGLGAFYFQADLSGFDAYLPPQEEIESVGIRLAISSMQDVVSKNKREILRQMQLPCDSEVYALLAHLVEEQKEVGGKEIEGTDETDKRYAETTVLYQLKNGKEVYRSYRLPAGPLLTDLSLLFDKPAFRDTYYAPCEETYAIESISLMRSNVRFSVEDQDLLREALRRDREKLTSSVIREETPIGVLQFWLTEEKEQTEEEAFWLPYHGSEKNSYYACTYLFPCFTDTLEILEEMGVHLNAGPAAEEIEKITLQHDLDGSHSEEEITDKEEIKALAPRLLWLEVCTLWQDIDPQLALVQLTGYQDPWETCRVLREE